MMRPLPLVRDAFVRDERGASAAEFALVLPLLIFLLLGILDAGRFMWEYNQAEKATQMGARYAVVADMVPSGLETYSFAVSDGILAGNPVPLANFTSAECNTANCLPCVGSVCGAAGYNPDAFDRIVARMRYFYGPITDANVRVEYRNVGLGYAGDPNGPDVAPMVTVSLTGMTFRPLSTAMLGSVTMPDFRASLTLEDGSGTVAN